jgi:hypothetical protein
MGGAGLTADELRFCARACAHIKLTGPVPHWFREYLAGWAEADRPDLASRLRAMSDETLGDVFENVRYLQSVGR